MQILNSTSSSTKDTTEKTPEYFVERLRMLRARCGLDDSSDTTGQTPILGSSHISTNSNKMSQIATGTTIIKPSVSSSSECSSSSLSSISSNGVVG